MSESGKYKNFLVNGTALASRGGLTVLKNFLKEMNENQDNLDKYNVKIYVVVSLEALKSFENKNIKIFYHPKPKKNMINKWFYENYTLIKLIDELKIHAYLSLQNVALRKIPINQYCLIHQPIPFSKLKFRELELRNYIKYKIIMELIYRINLKNINTIFVQTAWMKDAIRSKYRYKGPIEIISPSVESIKSNKGELPAHLKEKLNNNTTKLLYVTNNEKYKNNSRLIEAVRTYNLTNSNKVNLYITTDGKSVDCINYIGKVSYESIYSLYSSVDALIFPSLTETLGLPLLEAQEANLDILAASEPYAFESCPPDTIFFDPRSVESMVQSINKYVNLSSYNRNKKSYDDCISPIEVRDGRGYMEYIYLILNDLTTTGELAYEKYNSVK